MGRVCCLLAVPLLSLQLLPAQDAPPKLLTIDEAVAKALAAHPDLAVARANIETATLQREAARALPAPEFRLTVNNLAGEAEMTEIRNSLAWRWSPPRLTDLRWKTRIAEARRKESEADLAVAEQRIAASVRLAYRRASLAEARSGLATRMVALRREMLTVAQRQVANGLKESVEIDLAQLALAEAEALEQRALALASSEQRKLFRLLEPAGATAASASLAAAAPMAWKLAPVPLGPSQDAAPNPLATADNKTLADRVDFALAQRAELRQVAAGCDRYQAAASLAHQGRYPWMSFVQVTRRFDANAAVRGPWGVQLGVDLPLFRPAARAEEKIQLAEAARCRLEENSLRLRIRREVEEAVYAVELAEAELSKLKKVVDGPAQRAVDSARTALAAGRTDRFEVLAAEARQLSLQDRYLERHQEWLTLQNQLELATGKQ